MGREQGLEPSAKRCPRTCSDRSSRVLRVDEGPGFGGRPSAVRLMAPIRVVTGVVHELTAHFNDLVAWMRVAADKIAHGDCSSVTEAAEKIQKVIDGLASPVIDRVKELAGKVSAFFKGLWDRFGA